MYYVSSCLYHVPKKIINQKEWHIATKRLEFTGIVLPLEKLLIGKEKNIIKKQKV
jgi:hypothetical protein